LAKALICFYEAIAQDPNFAAAYSGVADYYNFLSVFAIMSPEESFPAAKEAARKAIELDPNLGRSLHFARHDRLRLDWDFAEAERI
jgi:tetratricopeptide (TPR) repeat protein